MIAQARPSFPPDHPLRLAGMFNIGKGFVSVRSPRGKPFMLLGKSIPSAAFTIDNSGLTQSPHEDRITFLPPPQPDPEDILLFWCASHHRRKFNPDRSTLRHVVTTGEYGRAIVAVMRPDDRCVFTNPGIVETVFFDGDSIRSTLTIDGKQAKATKCEGLLA